MKNNLTQARLLQLGYIKKKKMNAIYFQKGDLIILYQEAGIWEYVSDGNTEMSGGILFSTEEQLNELISESK